MNPWHEWPVLLALGQLMGAVVGAASAVLAEVWYLEALRDGKVTRKENKHIAVATHGLRFGMSLVLLSSLGLLVTDYLLGGGRSAVLTPSYGALFGIIVLIFAISWTMSKRPKTFAWGSLVTFSAWWFMVYLTLGALPIDSLVAAAGIFLGTLLLLSVILHSARSFARH